MADFKKSEKNEKTLNAKLYVRILPTPDFSYDSIKIERNNQVIHVRCLQDLSKGVKLKNPNYWCFCTDGIFWNSSQDVVYETVTSGLYDKLFDGVRAMIFCYGQTGTGKSFTASGLRFQFQDRGLILRVLAQMFEEGERRKEVKKIRFGMSYVEFIGETIRDLISDRTISSVREIVEYSLPNEASAWKLIFNAESRKSFSENAPYKGSNRGHTILTFYTHAESLLDTDPVITHSKINLVDMGGIDNFGNVPSAWKSREDLRNSNLSKCLMEQLILCLTGGTWKAKGHICPYKSSRFVSYLHDTMQSKSIIRFIAHIHGNEANLPITLSTLKFGERIKDLQPAKLERVLEPNCDLLMRNLEKEVMWLRNEVELSAMLNDAPNYCNVSQERLLEIKRAAEGYLFGQLESLTLLSLGQANLTLEVFRDFYQRLVAEKDQLVKDAVAAATEVLQNQLALERNSSSSPPVVLNHQKMSRRRSRQQEPPITFGASIRSTESVQNSGRVSSIVQQAGITDRKGIGIGPGKTSSVFEGNTVKAFKKLKSRKSDSVIFPFKGTKPFVTKEVGVPSSKAQIPDDSSELPSGIPSREVAWQCFFNEKMDSAIELRNNVRNREELAVDAKKRYTAALTELNKLREEIDECKMELENCLHIRVIYGRGELDEEGNPVPGEIEKIHMESIAQKEEQLNEAVENCHVALIDFRTITEELNEARKSLEEAFQDFCKENYKTTFVPEDIHSVLMRNEESEKGPTDEELRNQIRRNWFVHLQEKLINYVPRLRKKEWQKLFWGKTRHE